MQRNLATWSLERHRVRKHGRHAPPSVRSSALPVLQQTLDTVDLDAHGEPQERDGVAAAGIERDDDIAGLATEREHEQWVKIERIEQVLASADQSDPLVQEMREKTRLLRGRLLWDFNAELQGTDVAHAQGAA